MASPVTGLLVDVLGFLTGTALYVMLVVMVWRERAGEGAAFLARRGRLTLVTGVCGLVWNVGALLSFGTRVIGDPPPNGLLVALAFSALGCLPAVVVHSLLEGRETAAGRQATRAVIGIAYALSATAALLQIGAALDRAAVPSRPALWLLTGGFTGLTALLLVLTRPQPLGRRGIWVAALAIFAVSALHFGRHAGDESWWVEVIGHNASLPLALAILHQDYRFALADLFLKNAIALLLLVTLSLTLFASAVWPLARWQGPGAWDPRVVALLMTFWLATVLAFPALRRLANRVVDRVVLRRPDYEAALRAFSEQLPTDDAESAVLARLSRTLNVTLGLADPRVIDDPFPPDDHRTVVAGSELRTRPNEVTPAVLLRLRTVDRPYPALACGPMPAGRRLLSDDVRLIEAMLQLAARRLDSLRVALERLSRNQREQAMQQLATEAELRALRAQLHPHFLFNALTTVGYLIQSAPSRAIDTLMRLTTVLRAVLNRSGSEFSTLGDEIDLVHSYLDIERARFEERLRVEIDVPAALTECTLPTLLLQPLVENAVKHGLAPTRAGGTLRISATDYVDRLKIVVEDTGLGFDPAARNRTGVGLSSVAQRLAAHYGPNASFEIDSALGRGTRIEIVLPAERRTRELVTPPRRRTG